METDIPNSQEGAEVCNVHLLVFTIVPLVQLSLLAIAIRGLGNPRSFWI